jgi:hypothetical protein
MLMAKSNIHLIRRNSIQISYQLSYIYIHTHTHTHIYIYIYIEREREREREREKQKLKVWSQFAVRSLMLSPWTWTKKNIV